MILMHAILIALRIALETMVAKPCELPIDGCVVIVQATRIEEVRP